MFIQKLYFHIFAFIFKFIYKLLYRKRIIFGKNITFRKNLNIMIGKTGNISIGNNVFFNNNCSIVSLGKIEIGNGTIFGECVKIYDHNHRFSDPNVSIKKQGYSIGKIKIGSHCWIGSNVVILKNAVIEDNCVIGAGCIVSGTVKKGTIIKNIPTYIYEKIEKKT